MKKLFESLKFFSKLTFLVLLLMVGWVFVNAQNLFKGKKAEDKEDPFRTKDVFGDVPAPPPDPGPGPGPGY